MFVLPFQLLGQSIPEKRLPIIDMHLHVYGSPESFLEHRGDAKAIAALPTQIPPLDMKLEDANNLPSAYGKLRYQYARKVLSPEVTGDALMKQTVNLLRRYNIYAVANGKLAEVKTWVAYEPERIMPALKLGHPDEVPPEQLRDIMSKGETRVLGEITSSGRHSDGGAVAT